MTSLTELCLAILVLLVTPGPTNTLLFLAGTERGWRGTLRLIPAEVAGYLVTVIPLTLIGATLLASAPALRPAIALAAGLWVAWLALKLWQPEQSGTTAAKVTARMVFFTTLLNPKALIFGLVLLPATAPAQGFALFTALVVLVAVAWVWIGQRLPSAAGTGLALMRRAAACWLGLLSLGLLAKGFGA